MKRPISDAKWIAPLQCRQEPRYRKEEAIIGAPIQTRKEPQIPESSLHDFKEFWLQLNEDLRNRPEPREFKTTVNFPPLKYPAPKVAAPRAVHKMGNIKIPAVWTVELAEGRLRRLLLVFDRRCFYCGNNYPANFFNRDHLWPASKGGRIYAYCNLVLSCFQCNAIKGDRLPTDDEMIRARNAWWDHHTIDGCVK